MLTKLNNSLTKLFDLISVLRLDIYFFLYIVAYKLPHVTLTQLIQDKYCINVLKADPSKCLHLESLGIEFEDLKNQVITYSTKWENYDQLITLIPSVILLPFIGYWINTYPNHIKYLLALPCLGGLLSQLVIILNVFYFKSNPYYLLWKSVAVATCGGLFFVLSGSYTYLIRTTDVKYRVLRLAILELFLHAANSSASATGGKLLTFAPWFQSQHRNFFLVFLVSFISYFCGMIWVLIFLPNAIAIIEDSIEQKTGEKTNFVAILKEIFNLSTVKKMFKVCFRKRSHNRRAILWCLFIGMMILRICLLDDMIIGFQFVQKVYHWDAASYSYNFAIMIILVSILNAFLPGILIHKLQWSDVLISIIGSSAFIISLSILGGYLEPRAYFISKSLKVAYGLISPANLSILSRIIDGQESGQIFALISCIEAIAPAIGTVILSTIFKVTIGTFPGIAHHVTALFMFFPFSVSLWLGLAKNKWDPMVNTRSKKKEVEKTCINNQSVMIR